MIQWQEMTLAQSREYEQCREAIGAWHQQSEEAILDEQLARAQQDLKSIIEEGERIRARTRRATFFLAVIIMALVVALLSQNLIDIYFNMSTIGSRDLLNDAASAPTVEQRQVPHLDKVVVQDANFRQ